MSCSECADDTDRIKASTINGQLYEACFRLFNAVQATWRMLFINEWTVFFSAAPDWPVTQPVTNPHNMQWYAKKVERPKRCCLNRPDNLLNDLPLLICGLSERHFFPSWAQRHSSGFWCVRSAAGFTRLCVLWQQTRSPERRGERVIWSHLWTQPPTS